MAQRKHATTFGTRTIKADEVRKWLKESFGPDAAIEQGVVELYCRRAFGYVVRPSEAAFWVHNPDGSYFPLFLDTTLQHFRAACDTLAQNTLTQRATLFMLDLAELSIGED